ncbi:MAG TPA: hypothetical protein VG074_07255 [Acidimicrobiales bacterium]|nr:hypothetical protein [Acidimicrobiales bacterium]
MVETGIEEFAPNQHEIPASRRSRLLGGLDRIPSARRAHRRRWIIVVLVAVILLAAPAVAARPLGLLGGTQAARASTPPAGAAAPVHNRPAERAPSALTPPASASTITTAPAPTTTTTAPTAPAPASTPAAPVPTNAPIAALVAEVEASGVDPGPTWSWTLGDTATQCGVIPGNGAGTGCTFGAAGAAQTVFSGSPSLALVAHELANAETENDAIPSLMNEVAQAEAGTAWTPIDAVASCLVEHFMGFQDGAAGTWQCPVALATVVAANIHD